MNAKNKKDNEKQVKKMGSGKSDKSEKDGGAPQPAALVIGPDTA